MIYLDNAATGFPKPPSVTAEVVKCLCNYCGNPGRGAHPLALASAEKIFECREAISDFLGVGAPERIVFCNNTTHALNLALRGFLKPFSHVLISELEHNAVRRPLAALAKERNIEIEVFPVWNLSKQAMLEGLRRRVRKNTAALVCTHASNICSFSLPLREIGKFCHENNLPFFVDAAQSAGHLPIKMKEWHIDALAAPAHKGLQGIQGAGFLALSERITLEPILQGGSGVDSLSPEMPTHTPERFEAGTLPTPSIVGLLAGIRFLEERGVEEIHAHECALFEAAKERLLSLPRVRVFAPRFSGAVLLFEKEGVPSASLANELGKRGICTRAGLHCAPLAHNAIGTPKGGAVRISFGPFNTLSDLDALYHALK